MEVDQNVGAVVVNLLEGELRIPGPEIEGPTQFQPNPIRVQAARLLGSQAASKTKGIFPCERSID